MKIQEGEKKGCVDIKCEMAIFEEMNTERLQGQTFCIRKNKLLN